MFDPMLAFAGNGVGEAYNATPTRGIGNLTAEASGGNSAAVSAAANATAPADAKAVLYLAVGIVLTAIVLLVLMGQMVLKGV